jgi:hypothetical protein
VVPVVLKLETPRKIRTIAKVDIAIGHYGKVGLLRVWKGGGVGIARLQTESILHSPGHNPSDLTVQERLYILPTFIVLKPNSLELVFYQEVRLAHTGTSSEP